MLKSLKYILYAAFIIGAFLLGRSCDHEPQVIEKITHTSDTIYPDTVFVYKPRPYPVHDTEYVVYPYPIPPDSFVMAELYKVRYYQRNYRDKNMHVTIHDSVLGYLMAQKVDYRLFVPLKVVDTIRIEKTSVKAPKFEISGGIQANRTNLYLNGEIQFKKDHFNVGYDPFNKNVIVGYKRTLFSK